MVGAEQYLVPEVARRVQRLDLKAKFIVEGFLTGLHASPYRGFSPEFSEHRRYVAGDDPKTLDWKAWAKTDRLFVKAFEAETNLSAYLLVDTSRSMALGGADGAMSKLEYATALAAALGYLLVGQSDAVGLGLLGEGLSKLIAPHASRRHLVRVLSELAQADGAGRTALADGLHAVARRVRRRSLMVVLSDLVDETDAVLAGLKHLASRGHNLIVFQVLDPAERHLDLSGPIVLEDPETGEAVATDADAIRDAYAGRLEAFIEAYRRGVHEAGGDFAVMTTSTPFDAALARFLHERKRRF
jgi:uncharacterized protein (DUF58 family)